MYNNNNYYFFNNNNPDWNKSLAQLKKEIEILKEKIKYNNQQLESASNDMKVKLNNIIMEDQMRIVNLENTIQEKENIIVICSILIIILIIFIIIIICSIYYNSVF